MAGDLVISTINGQAIGTKNVIIDGNFNVNQRGVSGTVTLAAGAYGHDRWKGGASGATYTFATVANVTTLTISAGSLIQVVEGLNLQSGTYTLSFSGTAQGKINGGSYSASGVTGTATGGTNMSIEFNTGTLSLVQLEKGSTATSFDYRPYGTELALCQRYFQVLSGGVSGVSASATTFSGTVVFPVCMRSAPASSVSAAYRVSDIIAASFTQSSGNVSNSLVNADSGVFSFANFTGMTTGKFALSANSSTGNLLLSSEL